MIFAGILAGGSGERIEKTSLPKQFIEIGGVPIFIRTLCAFLKIKSFDKVIVSINVDWSNTYEKMIVEYGINREKVELIPGGKTRFESLINVAKKADEIANGTSSIIATHDCARPFVSVDDIKNNLSLMSKYDVVTTSIPMTDTISRSINGEIVTSIPKREELWAGQTPQSFFVKDFLSMVSNIPIDELVNYNEANKIYLENNRKVAISKGSRTNFKITNDIDVEYAEFLLERNIINGNL